MVDEEQVEREQARIENVAEHREAVARQLFLENRRKARQEALKPSPEIDELYRQGAVKVQWMKTRYKKYFEPDDVEYTIYGRAKRHLSKVEYALRQITSTDKLLAQAVSKEEIDDLKKDWEKYMKNALFSLYAVNSLYSDFLDGIV